MTPASRCFGIFIPKNLAELELLTRERAGEIIDALSRNKKFNWVIGALVELKSQMLATLFDIPQEDKMKLIDWSDNVSDLVDPDCFERPDQGFQELFRCLGYFTKFTKNEKHSLKIRSHFYACP